MDNDNKRDEVDNIDKRLHISDVMCSLTDDEKLLVVKKLREETEWGMMDCKRALNESKWNYDIAKSWLIQFRKKSGIFFY
jgi:ribosomal protein L7/L12